MKTIIKLAMLYLGIAFSAASFITFSVSWIWDTESMGLRFIILVVCGILTALHYLYLSDANEIADIEV